MATATSSISTRRLATWLDHDLAQVGSGGLKLADIVAGDGAALLTTLAAAPGEVKTEVLDLDLKTRGGHTVPVRLFHKVAFGADGTPGASRTLVLNRARDDGTDPQRAAEVRFMRFFQNTPMAIATVDKTGRIARTNALFARLFQPVLKGEGAAAARSWRSWPSATATRSKPRSARRPTGRARSRRSTPRSPATGERSARFYVTAGRGGGPRPGGGDRLRARDHRAAQAGEPGRTRRRRWNSVGKLAGGIAHDFNNVLSAIMMATDFLLNAHKPTDPSFQDIMQIKQNANRAAAPGAAAAGVLAQADAAAAGARSRRGAVATSTMLLRRLIGEKVTLDVVHGRDLWPVKADISQFEQVIVNLAVNARDAMPDGGKLTVRTANVGADESAQLQLQGHAVGDYVLVEVADTGTGIPPEIIDKIFEPFFSTKEVGKGTGLGLSTVYGIVKQTGGFIYAESAGRQGHDLPHLPAAPHAGRRRRAAAACRRRRRRRSPARIAAADDAMQHRRPISPGRAPSCWSRTRRACARSTPAASRRAATPCSRPATASRRSRCWKSSGGKVDLVVSDVVMPEMDGPTLLEGIAQAQSRASRSSSCRATPRRPSQKNLPEGAQFAFLAKPFTLKQLVAAVKETMAG